MYLDEEPVTYSTKILFQTLAILEYREFLLKGYFVYTCHLKLSVCIEAFFFLMYYASSSRLIMIKTKF